MATLEAPKRIESLTKDRDDYDREIAELTEGIKRYHDKNWHRWPEESYDDYRAWMENMASTLTVPKSVAHWRHDNNDTPES